MLWHDGVPTTARDVEFTYLRAKDPATGFPGSSALEYYEGVQVVDSFTVRFRLRPHSGALEPWRTLAILPAHLLGRVPPERLRAHPFGKLCPVGNGPFRFVEHRAGESWSFEANPAFPPGLGGRPKLDGYVYRVIPEQTTLLAELLSGGIDLYVKVPPSQATAVEEAAGVRLLVFPFREFVFVGWNSRRPQLADARVRRAMTLATNRRQIVDALLGGHGRVANTGVPPFHWAFDPALADSLAYDPGRARALLEEAGWVDRDGDGVREDRDGTPLSLTIRVNQGNRTRSDIAEIMQAELQRIGVELRPLSLEWGTFIQGLTDPAARDFDAFVLSFVADFQVDETDLFRSDRIDGPLAFSGTRNEALDSLLRRLPLTEDRVEARRMWREYQRLIVEEQPYTYLFFEDRLDGVAERLRNVRMDARGDWVGISSWEIPTDRRRHRSADGG
ncbi:MAG: ABC transporter substrate-binding protein [Gemmatimonadota bacterium]